MRHPSPWFGIVLASLGHSPTFAGATYVVTDLGQLTPNTNTLAYGINNAGQVVGYSATGPGFHPRPFLWSPTTPNGATGSMVDLGTLGGPEGVALAVNDQGRVCGYADDGKGGRFAFVWIPDRPNGSSGTMTSLGLALPDTIGTGMGINSAGQITGGAQGDYLPQPFLWTPIGSSGEDGIAVFIGATYGTSNDVNELGQITGFLGSEAFRWTPAEPNGSTGSLELITSDAGPDFASSRSGAGINVAGVVAGAYQPPALGGESHGFLWTTDLAIDLTPDLRVNGSAFDINDLGHVVGRISFASNTQCAWFYDGPSDVFDPAHLHDLNALVDPAQGWELHEALGINDLGQIVGVGKHEDSVRAFLLTPASIPSSTEGTLLCADGTPLAGCQVTLDYHDSTGLVSSVVTTTDGAGAFSVVASCTFSNGVGEHFIVSTPCCAHTWTIVTTCCCGNLGTLTCDCCEPFERCCPENDACPPGAIDEQAFEPCGQDLLNGGCNSTPTTFQPIACGDTICGTFWYDGLTRDTDWFEFTISQPQEIVWSVWADVPVTVLVMDANCPPDLLAIGVGNCPAVATTPCVAPGTYRVFVAPDFSAPSIACLDLSNAWRYLALLDCRPCPSTCEPGFGSCFAAHPWGGCDDVDCCFLVCAAPGHAHCCNVAWDAACVAFAWTFGECQSGSMGCPYGGTPTVHVCQAGCRDGFATADGPEPANGASCSCATCVDFDVVAPNQCVQHTFVDCWPSCPAGCGPFACGEIVGAFLEIGTKFVDASSDPVDISDSLDLLDGGTSVASFSLLGANSVVNATGAVFLDLANLPFGGGNILSTLCDGELGIMVTDDRAVDYAWLTVIHCPCKNQFRPFIQGDADDGFSSPTESYPHQSIVEFVIDAGYSVATTYDTNICNAWFLESFDDLPSCIDRAHLHIGLRQCPPDCIQSNDSIQIEVAQACGLTWGWSMPFSALGAFMSPATIGCAPTTLLSLDLANLPPDGNGTTDVIGLVLDGRLDILIQDDTGVDYIIFEPTICDCCDGDLDGDGLVSGADLGVLLGSWGPCPGCPADANGDGAVDGADLGAVLGAWGACGG